MGILKVDGRHITRIFFPSLYDPGTARPQTLSQKDFTFVYDKVIHAAVHKIVPHHQPHWPPSYEHAYKLYQDGTQRKNLRLGTIDLAAEFVPEFGKEIIRLLDQAGSRWNHAFFQHEFRGVKLQYTHDLEEDDAHIAIQKFFQIVDETMAFSDDSDWSVDIGVEIRIPNYVVQFDADGHRSVLLHCLPRLAQEDPDRFSQFCGSPKVKKDIVAQLGQLAGLRCVPATFGQYDGVPYLQAYPTDKSSSYQLHKEGMFRHRGPEALTTTTGLDHFYKDINSMMKLFEACQGPREDEDQPPLEGNARIEVRVPLSEWKTANMVLSDDLITNGLIKILPRDLWWVLLSTYTIS